MRRYSDVVMDHFSSPRNYRKLETADLVGVAGVPGRGRFMVVYLRVDQNRVVEAAFQCNGCGATIASGSMLTEMISDKAVEECRLIQAADLIKQLNGLPEDKHYCAAFAVRALQEALTDDG